MKRTSLFKIILILIIFANYSCMVEEDEIFNTLEQEAKYLDQVENPTQSPLKNSNGVNNYIKNSSLNASDGAIRLCAGGTK